MQNKIIVSFEVDKETSDFINKRAKMTGRTKSSYLRQLVTWDKVEHDQLVEKWWSNQLKFFEQARETSHAQEN